MTYVGLVDFGVIAILQRDVAFALGNAEGVVSRATTLPDVIGENATAGAAPATRSGAFVPRGLALPSERLGRDSGSLAIVLVVFIVTFVLRIQSRGPDGASGSRVRWKGQYRELGGEHCDRLPHGMAGVWAVCARRVVGRVPAYLQRHLPPACRRRRFAEVLPRTLPTLSRTEAIERLRKGFWVVVSQLAVILLNGTDVIIIGMILGSRAVVPYALTDKLVTMLASVPQLLVPPSLRSASCARVPSGIG